MIRYYAGIILCLGVGVGLAQAGDDFSQFNHSVTALPTSPNSTTYLSSSGARVEVYQTGPNTSYGIHTDRHGHTTATGTIYSTPAYAPVYAPLDIAPPPPVGNLFTDPLADPLGLGRP